MIIPEALKAVLDINPQILGGAIRFQGTRVPVQALIDTLDDGDGIEDFLDGYPGVSKQQGEAVIHWEQSQARPVFGLELAG